MTRYDLPDLDDVRTAERALSDLTGEPVHTTSTLSGSLILYCEISSDPAGYVAIEYNGDVIAPWSFVYRGKCWTTTERYRNAKSVKEALENYTNGKF